MNPFRDDDAALVRRERDELKAAAEEHAAELAQARDEAAELTSARAAALHEAKRVRELLADAETALRARKRGTFRQNATWAAGWLAIAGLAIVIVVWICGAIADCNDARHMEAGMIVRRVYHPAYTTTVCTSTTKTSTCHPVYHPERFTLTLADGEHEEREVDMPEEAWRRHAPGEWMCIERTPCVHPHDDAVTR